MISPLLRLAITSVTPPMNAATSIGKLQQWYRYSQNSNLALRERDRLAAMKEVGV
jgi:hypothetical protein